MSEIRSLAGQGFATDAEVQAAEAREQAAGRELKAAREHHSRLKQEFDQTEIQVRLLQMRTLDPGSDIAVAEAEYEDANAALNVATERSGRLSVTAPGPGTIIDLPVHAGDWVSAGTLMVRIADLSSLLVSAPVTVGVAQRLTTGQPVRLRLPTDPPRRLDARISEVTLAPDSGQQAYLIRVLTPNPTPGVALVGLAAAIEINHFRRR